MATKERVISRSADDGTLICRFEECLQEPLTDDGSYSTYIFTIYE